LKWSDGFCYVLRTLHSFGILSCHTHYWILLKKKIAILEFAYCSLLILTSISSDSVTYLYTPVLSSIYYRTVEWIFFIYFPDGYRHLLVFSHYPIANNFETVFWGKTDIQYLKYIIRSMLICEHIYEIMTTIKITNISITSKSSIPFCF
jgi:hypothetical protein